MKPTLTFEKKNFLGSRLGGTATVGDLCGSKILQNGLCFELEDTAEIYEGYGCVAGAYPYMQYESYSRKLEQICYETAILENDYIKATFLPELGGRLWSLINKKTGKNLLYTNDVIRFSNLSIRNAWFSGGVEWNIGVIGHTPFTTNRLFTAVLDNDRGNPVLRMYEFERIREVEYQMDFWLDEADTFLNCRMRVKNSSRDVIPMYWWSNIAVPEFDDGRVIMPTCEAYTSDLTSVRKVPYPMVDGTDVSHYRSIQNQVDYFFQLEEGAPRYITNVDGQGEGLLQLSTERLQGRKVFSWGNNDGSDAWQAYLTKNAGRYLEIQAGLGKTQYGCIPMAPNTAWEWMEQYGPISLGSAIVSAPFAAARETVTEIVRQKMKNEDLNGRFAAMGALAKTKAETVFRGSGYGQLKNRIRELEGGHALSTHLDYQAADKATDGWIRYLETGIMGTHDPMEPPADFISESMLFERLKGSVKAGERYNWYAYFQLGLYAAWRGDDKQARSWLEQSLLLAENPWSCHALACLHLKRNETPLAIRYMRRGLSQKEHELSYLKEGFRLLLAAHDDIGVAEYYSALPALRQEDPRLFMNYLTALHRLGRTREAYDLLEHRQDFVLDDLREGLDTVAELYQDMCVALFGVCDKMPKAYNFDSLRL